MKKSFPGNPSPVTLPGNHLCIFANPNVGPLSSGHDEMDKNSSAHVARRSGQRPEHRFEGS